MNPQPNHPTVAGVASQAIPLIATVFLFVMVQAASADERSAGSFLEASQAWLPSQAVIASREATGLSVGFTEFGYDPGSGAWFFVTPHMLGGRDASGLSYTMRWGEDSPRPMPQEPLPHALAFLYPPSVLVSLHERPEMIAEVQLDDGVWRVRFQLPETNPGQPGMASTAHFQADDGRLVLLTREDQVQPVQNTFEWETVPFGRAINPSDRSEYAVVLDEDVRAERFETASVISRMTALQIAQTERSAVIESGFVRTGDTGDSAAGRPHVRNPASGYRVPLLIGGAVLVLGIGFVVHRVRPAS